MKNNIKVIFFDMGNTLLHFHHGKSDEEKDEKGIEYLTNFLQKYDSRIKYEDVKKKFFTKWQNIMPLRKITHIEYPVESFLNNFLKSYDVNLSLNMCIKALDIFYTEYRKYIWIEEELIQTLSSIVDKRYKIGVISNASIYDEVMINCFKEAGIAKYIDSFTFSYYLKIGKPNKQIFQHALNEFQVKPNESVMIGDNLSSDIAPAKELGLKSIWYNKNKVINNTDIKPDMEICQIKDLNKLL
ncbi:HAD family hydrolase [Sporosalibacterium faouarense]|uniref:HAD family hydrolase n=1 Tax=Sporosalibacterium faouarense TaxID=516123 RepID=UPI00141C5618|nr:HAD family hydrolase [Sporosalibacterium faouarense]MTI47935.1 HAD family hydrolase [Bacillota bacterium]